MSRRQLHQSHVPDWAQTQNFQQVNTASGTLADWEDMFNSPSRNGNGNGSNRNGGDAHDDPNTNPPEEPPEDAFFALLRQDDESKFMENRPKPQKPRRRPPNSSNNQYTPRIPTPRSSVENVDLSRPTSSSSLRNSREGPPARRTRRKKPEARNPHDDMVISSGGQGAFSDQAYLDKVIEDDKKKWELMQKKKEKENGRKSKKPTGIKRSNSIPGKSSSTNADPSSSKMNNPKPLSVHRVQSKIDFDVQNGPQGGEKDTRRNLDKRTARLRHAPHFSAAVKYWRVKNEGYNCNHNHREQVYDDSATTSRSINGVSVFVRKRPLFDYEKKRLDYDVISVKSYSERDCDEVVVHNCGMHPDMKKMLHKPTRYKCSAAFDQFASNDDIFNNVGRPMVEKCLTGSIGTILMYGQTGSGKTYTMTSIEERATGLLFDLIGREEEERGEEFTVTLKFIELAGKKAVDLLGRKQGAAVKIVDEMMGMGHSVDEVKEEEAGGAEEQELDVGESLLLVNNKSDLPTGRIRADFEEFGVKKMIEMEKSLKMGGDKGSYVLVLMNSGEAASMALAKLAGEYPDMLRVDKQTGLQMGLDPSDLGVAKNGGANGPVVTVKWKGAAELEVTSTEQMLKYISVGKSRRATEATDVNGTSSRSHAVLQITLLRKGGRGSKKRGVLTLIDCAGSERRNDSMYHDKARQKESAEINNSLWALKNCIRARCEILEKPNTFIPYRSSLLTRVLRESFERDTALLSIIATAAPNATDTEHTMETLKTVSTIVGTEKDVEEIETEQVMQAHKLQEMLVAQGSGGGGGAEKPTRTVIMPIKWSHEQLKRWLTKARGGEFQQVAKRVVKSDTGKTIMAQTIPKLERSLCQNDNILATSLYNSLRGESDKIAKVLLKERKSRQALAKGQEAY